MDPDQNSQDSGVQEEEDPFVNVNLNTIPKMADELRALSSINSQAKNEIVDRFLENDATNLQKLGQLFEVVEK